MVYVKRALLIACGVLAGATLLIAGAGAARADGLDLTCSTRSGPVADIDTSTAPEVLESVDVVFRGRAAASVPVTGDVEIDPETGDKLFTRTWRPTSGGTFYLDFLEAAGVELSFGLRPRVHSGADGPVPYDLGFGDLMRENFALSNDFPTDLIPPFDEVRLAGLDVSAFASEALAALPEGIEGRLEVHVRFRTGDGAWTTTRIGVGLDSRASGADLPRRSDVGVSFKRVFAGGGGTPTDYIVVGQHYLSWTTDGPRPGLGVRVDVDELSEDEGGATLDPLVDVDLDYSNVPESMAVGLRSRCRPWDPTFASTGHLAWNHAGLSTEDAAATTMDLRVRSGIEAGLPIRIAEYDPYLGGGWRDTFADEVDVDARIVGLPERLDWIMHPDSMGITRSTDVTPDVILNHARLAQDDPATSDDRPLHAEGLITDLAEHSRVQAGFAADGSLETLDLQFFDVACASGAPEDDLFPPGPQGCRRDGSVALPEAHVLAQNWLPDDLIAQGAWAGMASPPLTQSQYVYYASRDSADGVPVDLWRGGARLVGLRQAAYDSSEEGEVKFYVDRDESHVDTPPWSPPGECIPLPPYWECSPWFPPDPDPAQVVIDVDGRTADDEVVNTGTRVEASGRVPDLPAALRLDVETSDFVTKAKWWATGAIEIDGGLIRATLPGPAATLVDAAFEVGNGGAGLSPAGEVVIEQETVWIPREICIVILGRRFCRPTGGGVYQPTGWRNVAFRTPGAPADGFPTVGVPVEVIHPARLKAGVVATTRDGRLGGTRIRSWVDASLAPGAVVRWDEHDGTLAHVEGSFCGSGTDCANWFHGVVVSGPPEIREWERLINKPVLPAAPAAVADVMPPFDDTWLYTDGESGVRAVLAGPDEEWGLNRWGVEAFVESVAAFEYTSEGNDVRVELAGGSEPQAFNVDLVDATRRPPASFGPLYIPLMVDARIDRLPEQMRLRMNASDTSAAADTPWIWVNTEDVDITDPADVDWDLTDEPGTRPRLTGLVRMGYTSMLAGMAAGERPTPARSVLGADVWAKFASSGPFGVDVVADVEVPRHVAIWQPSLEECNATQSRDRVAACQSRPLYEMDEWQEVRALFRTTRATLGDLHVNARVAGEDSDYGIEGAVEHVPGRLDATVRLTQNRRLPWLEATLDLDANAPLGDVQVAVTDNRDPRPAAYRLADGSIRSTPNYAAVLRDVPADLNVSARVFGLEARLTPDVPADSPCHASSGDLGYLHAVLELAGGASDVDIDVQETNAGLAADLRADAPVSGWVNTRIDDLVACESRYEDKSPFHEHMRSGGIFGSRGAQMVPLVALVDVILGGLAELFLASDADIEVFLDADLPIFFEFDSVTELRVAQNFTTLSVDEHHGGGEGDPTTIGVRQRSLPYEETFQIDGAWFRRRDVRMRSTEWGLEDFDVSNHVETAFGDVGLHRWQRCVDSDEQGEDEPGQTCYKFGNSKENVGTVADFPTREDRGDQFTSADIVLDPIFSAANRDELYDEDDGYVEPGRIFYYTVADLYRPAEADWFVTPELAGSRTRTGTPTFTWRPDVWVEYPPFSLESNCSPIFETSNAIGADGTRYGLKPLCDPIIFGFDTPALRIELFDGFSLEAEFANGAPRWAVALPDPVGFDPAGNDTCERNLDRNCRVRTRIAPQGNGSVQVTLTTERPYNIFGMRVWRSIGTKYAWLDASGHPANHLARAPELPNLFAASFRDTSDRSGVTTLDPCGVAAWACASPPADHTLRWVFGDGEISEPSSAAPTAVLHDYPSTRTQQSYYGMLLMLDPGGEVVEKAPFIVNAGGWSILDGSWGWAWPWET